MSLWQMLLKRILPDAALRRLQDQDPREAERDRRLEDLEGRLRVLAAQELLLKQRAPSQRERKPGA